MAITAKTKYIRIAPRKVRLVADMIRGQRVKEAKSLLHFTVNRSALPISKLLNSAVVSAKNNLNWNEENLLIEKITVDEGPKLKRWMPRARGSASPIQKKTSHITIVLEEVEKTDRSMKKKKEKIDSAKVDSLKEVKEGVSSDEKKRPSRADKSEMVGKARSDVKSKIFRRKAI